MRACSLLYVSAHTHRWDDVITQFMEMEKRVSREPNRLLWTQVAWLVMIAAGALTLGALLYS
jgi:hypothetical protein